MVRLFLIVLYCVLQLCFYAALVSGKYDVLEDAEFGSEIRRDLDCWTHNGTWKLNGDMQLSSNILTYAPCIRPMYTNDPEEFGRCQHILKTSSLKYSWNPDSTCLRNHNGTTLPYEPFSTKKFCNLMEGKGNILVVGDSISTHTVMSWRNKIYSDMGYMDTCPGGLNDEYDTSNTNIIPRCFGLQLHRVRNDRLSLTKSVKHDNRKNIHEWPWIQTIKPHNISNIILNTGSHFRPTETLLEEIRETLLFLRLEHPSVNIIWRNTPVGHLDFQQYMNASVSHPLRHPPKLLKGHSFHYDEMAEQNNIVKNFLEVRTHE